MMANACIKCMYEKHVSNVYIKCTCQIYVSNACLYLHPCCLGYIVLLDGLNDVGVDGMQASLVVYVLQSGMLPVYRITRMYADTYMHTCVCVAFVL